MTNFINFSPSDSNMKRGSSAVLDAKREIKKDKTEKTVHNVLLSFFLITMFLSILLGTLHIMELTGFTSYVQSKGGSITEVQLEAKFSTWLWGGVYGLVLRVPEFTQQLSEDLEFGEVQRSDVFFDCILTSASGGPEVFAANISNLDLTGDVSPGTTQMVDDFLGCTTEEYCADDTFTSNMTIYLGSTQIDNIPSTHTYKYNGENLVFDVGILNVSGNLVFVSHINSSIQAGYNPNTLVNFQMLLPTPDNSTITYYFYNDPYDQCPQGGLGLNINTTIWGYVTDNNATAIENATVTVGGESTYTNASGFYNFSTLLLEGTFNVVFQKSGYGPNITTITVNSSDVNFNVNATLETQTTDIGGDQISNLNIFGTVTDITDSAISGAVIYFGNNSGESDSSGDYSFNASVVPGSNPIIAIKTNYDNYYTTLNITSNMTEYNHNISMSLANLYSYPTGPFTESNIDDAVGDSTSTATAQSSANEYGQDYWVSTSEIDVQVRENTFVEKGVSIYNFRGGEMRVQGALSGDILEIVKLGQSSLSITSDNFENFVLTISGTKPIGIYRGVLTITGDIEQEIPIKIEIVPRKLPIESLELNIDLFKGIVRPGGDLKYRLNLNNLLTEQGYKVELKHLILNQNGTEAILEENEEVEIQKSLTLLRQFNIPADLPEGEYSVSAEARYLNHFSSVTSPFLVSRPIYLYSFFGIPLWIIFVIISFISFVLLNLFLYKRHIEKKKRFHLALNTNTLPKPGERSIKIGKLAERKDIAYYNIDDFTTHGIVAGATGGGKSISAQVFVEEMLMKGIAVIVFDPTAQWSGMLRKCDDKRMLSLYPQFGLKPTDAKGFPGSVRQITNHLQSIDVNKYAAPGQIQVFTMNKLDPKQIDVFVAGVINNIFKSDPKEFPQLRTLLIFDEVHRLLPKFGGSGKGFLQIERACREFRKWGYGVMLVSQVLSDFVGEIKANINTEVLMRAAEEKDLERIKERYGLDALKSLVRAGVGTGMIQNAEYNKGLPYFVSFRPILHNTRRLTDEVLDKYNQYNDTIDDLQYQIEQLEAEKVDAFDLKMELKLVKDKLMTGNFTVVDIYLEGLKPRLDKQWETLGKKAKKREIVLINESELESSLAALKKDRQNLKKEGEGKEGEKKEEKVDPGAKIVVPITFNNGMMISSLNELKEVLPNFDISVLKEHVNDEKNEIADWISAQVDKSLGEKVKPLKTREEILAAVQTFGKEEPKKEGEEKKETPKEGEKKEEPTKKEPVKNEKPEPAKKEESKKDEKK